MPCQQWWRSSCLDDSLVLASVEHCDVKRYLIAWPYSVRIENRPLDRQNEGLLARRREDRCAPDRGSKPGLNAHRSKASARLGCQVLYVIGDILRQVRKDPRLGARLPQVQGGLEVIARHARDATRRV